MATPPDPAERDLAMLAAAGPSDRQIANELVLSVRTAESQLQRVCGKLGLSQRHQLAEGSGPEVDPYVGRERAASRGRVVTTDATRTASVVGCSQQDEPVCPVQEVKRVMSNIFTFDQPAVQVQGAMSRMSDGATITLNGDLGTMRIPEDSAVSQPESAVASQPSATAATIR